MSLSASNTGQTKQQCGCPSDQILPPSLLEPFYSLSFSYAHILTWGTESRMTHLASNTKPAVTLRMSVIDTDVLALHIL